MTGMEEEDPVSRRIISLTLLLVVLLPFTASSQQRVRMATTTSTENSGLLDVLLPPFEEKLGVKVDVIAVGTGKALKLGENGDVDLVLVHARGAEDQFVRAGYGVNRRDVMYNDFILIGPSADPADIRGAKDAYQAFTQIANTQARFASRGDESGTHKKEELLWQVAEQVPQGDWYMETGQGMGPTLQVANEKRAYTLTDRGTYLAYASKLELPILLEGDKCLFNPYGIIAVNPARHSHVKYVYAMALIGWVTSVEGQRIIAGYQESGEVLFHPMAIQDGK